MLRQQQADDRAIQANNFGGLNTQASSLNLPFGDSPVALNVDLTASGEVRKRRGTQRVQILTSSTSGGVGQHSVNLPNGTALTLVKVGNSLQVVYAEKTIEGLHRWRLMYTKNGVFTNDSFNVRPNFVDVGGVRNRTLILHPRQSPVNVNVFTDNGVYTTYPDAVNAFGFGNAELFGSRLGPNELNTAGSAICALIQDFSGNWQFHPGTVSTGVNSTYPYRFVPTDTTLLLSNRPCLILNVTWQYFAESLVYAGNRFYDYTSRFGTTVFDRHIAIPANIRDDADLYLDNTLHYGIFVSRLPAGTLDSNGAGGAGYAHTTNIATTNTAEYFFSQGKPANVSDYQTQRTNQFITFGDNNIAALLPNSQGAVTVHFHRIRKLNFRQAWSFLNIGVILHFASTQITGVSTPYRLTQPAIDYIGFTNASGGVILGVPLDDLVKIVHLDNNLSRFSWRGALSSNVIISPIHDGCALPVFGFGDYADYNRGYFPTTGCKYQDRLCLGGVASQPRTLIFSSISDTSVPGEYWNGFQIDAFTPPETGAFDFQLDARTSEAIQSVDNYQGSLLVTTQTSTYRLVQTQAGLVSQLVGAAGSASPLCTAVGLDRMVLASVDGVYEVRQAEGLSDSYQLVPLDGKINNTLVGRTPVFVEYDSVTNRVYVAYDNADIYVLHGDVDGWTQYKLYQAERVFDITTSLDWAGKPLTYITTLLGENVITSVMNWRDFIDYAYIPSPGSDPDAPYFGTFTVVDGVRLYPMQLQTTGIDSIEDVQLVINGKTYQYGTEFVKRGDYLYINGPMPTAGSLAVINHKNPDNGTIYDQVSIPGRTTKGYVYLSMFYTIPFVNQRLADYKRITHFNILFANFEREVYLASTLGGGFPATEWVGKSYLPFDCNVVFRFSHENDGEVSYDLYGLKDLAWDYSLFDTAGTHIDDTKYYLVREPVQGVGYDFQAVLWNWGYEGWGLSGYQLDGLMKGRRYQPESL
jgi:hypothetical protein